MRRTLSPFVRRRQACLGARVLAKARLPRCMATLVAAVFLFAAPTAQAARSEFFGITDNPVLDEQNLQQIASSGVKTYRFPLSWDAVEPSRGAFDWGLVDDFVGALASRGILAVPVLCDAPEWAGTGGPQRPPVSTSSRTAWQSFLKRAVGRYGPGGSYWKSPYHQQFGAGAAPWPIHSWQIWNEPNLKFSYPGKTVKQKAQSYAQLVQISHDAIKAGDHHAQIVLAGGPASDLAAHDASVFLDQVYSQAPRVKDYFDAAAIHPHGPNLNQVRHNIAKVRGVMKRHGDEATPLWITEFGWGSGPYDSASVNKGIAGQAQLLTKSYKMILQNRDSWNVQRLFWYRWRDPPPVDPPSGRCLLCASAGLLTDNQTPKPAFNNFLAFTAETTPPSTSITSGPGQGALTSDPTPRFDFHSSEPGSSFSCKVDSGSYAPCRPPYTTSHLANGSHTFSVRAKDVAGNTDPTPASRSFTVATPPPNTKIKSARVNRHKRKARFRFSSSQRSSTFTCKIDRKAYRSCNSPKTYKHLKKGRHTFKVKARNPQGKDDSSPARRRFRI
jgi:hypothetical protein